MKVVRNKTGNDNFSNAQHLSFALSLMADGCFNDAIMAFKEILKHDFSNESALLGGKCCNYWKTKIEKLCKEKEKKSFSYYKTGSLLFEEWNKFILTFNSSKETENIVLNCMMQYVLGLALEYFKKAEFEGDVSINVVQLFTIIAFLNKELGKIDEAICYFQKVIQTERFNADAYAQLGNCYELQGNERAAKIMLREAFFLDPAGIDLTKLENSQLIAKIRYVMKQYEISEDTFVFWMPVYARVYNILDVKRELVNVEVARIQKHISSIKRELESNSEIIKNKNELEKFKAMLIIRYLWLYDYFQENESNKDEMKKVEECIKELSFTIYNILKNSI
ncbi:MAG: hypothetical protein UHW86_02715 [Spirochaetota bacterium]|nr:hypothetical protein [Spirochaetota bacterium]